MISAWRIAIAVLVPMTTAWAQEGFVWSDVDCARSRVAPISGATCRTTNVAAAADVAGGPGRRHAVRGVTPQGYVNVVVSEGIGSAAYLLTSKNTADYLKVIDKRAADGSEWSDIVKYDGAEYHTFKSSEGEACVGFRRFGETRSRGYAWLMSGLLCAPKGEMLQSARIVQFIDAARVR